MFQKKYKIFIVEDDDFLLDMYVTKFRGAGFEVEIAKSGEEALEKARQGYQADLVLFDIVMPNIDGFEMFKVMKREKLIPKAIFVVLSNLGEKKDVEKGTQMGVDDYIVKAYNTPTEVTEKLKNLLENKI
ncbi:MAG: response regulator [Patescibacteria group bacterium]